MKELLALNIYFKRYAAPIWTGIFCVLMYNIAGVLIPVIVRLGLDDALFKTQLFGGFSSVSAMPVLITGLLFSALIVIAAIIKGLFMYWMRQKIVVVSRHIEYDLKNDIYHKYQQLSPAFYRAHQTGDLMARISEDVSNVRMYTGPAVLYLVNFLFTFFTVIFQMFYINSYLAFLVLIPLPVLSFSIYKVSVLINRRNTAIQNQLSQITSAAQETFAGIRVIKSFGVEQIFRKNFQDSSIEYRRLHLKLAVVNSLFFPLMLVLVGLSTLAVLYFGGKQAIEGQFTTGNIAEFVLYLNLLIWPVASLGYTSALVQKAASSQKRINEFLNAEKEESAKEYPHKSFSFSKELVFDKVSLQYQGKEDYAVADMSFKINKGEIIGITGPTGSGKSSVAQLLVKMYNPVAGHITVDGVDIEGIEPKGYVAGIGYVPQDVFLFSDSIRENIKFGRNAARHNEAFMEACISIAGLDKDIAMFPEGLETLLGERGITLSGGQKQRVSIARALYRDAPFYIFDDCLSAVDTQTESLIIEGLKSYLKGKTCIIISHRLSPLQFCDRILYMKEGSLAETGTHEELMRINGGYAALYNMQISDYKKAEIV